jgi:uncharacterized membrane protein
MSHKVYAPNVHLFAFHADSNGSTNHLQSSTNVDEDILWIKGNDILTKFQSNQELRIKKVSGWGRFSLLEGATDSSIFLPFEGKIVREEEKHRITGCACPLKIEDSYALALNLRLPEWSETGQKTDDVDLTIFKDFNPDQCFLPGKMNSSLGQTLLITGWLSQKQQQSKRFWREIADECVQNFLGEERENCPPLYQAGQLFGSPIFEYGNPYQPQKYGQILVWLFAREAFNGQPDSRLDNNFGFFYQKFIDLCLYRQKVIKAYQRTLEIYADIRQRNQTLKEIINETAELCHEETNQLQVSSQMQGLSAVGMSYFKDQLRTLPKLALDYAENLKALEDHRLTIDTNTKNYAEKIRQIQERLPNYDLKFLAEFNQKTIGNLQDEIKIKIEDCGQGSSLVGKAIASIRGLVEIDKAQRDRTLEETLRTNEIALQEREKKLQIWMALVVTCLAVSSISVQVASPVQAISTYLNSAKSSASPISSFTNFFLSNFFDLLLQTLVGVTVALLLGIVVWMIPKQSKRSTNAKTESLQEPMEVEG